MSAAAAQRAVRALVEYDGTAYAGWQVQPDRPTVQGTLETALAQITRESIRVSGAGRTDAGVHALGQVILFHTAWRHELPDLNRALNAVLPSDVALRDLAPAAPGFHPRFSARSRLYRYTVWTDAVRAPLMARYAHFVRPYPDVAGMNQAAAYLIGRHDFASFGADPERSQGGNTVRQVFQAAWSASDFAAGRGRGLAFDIEANAFLRGMVRTIVGALLEVGSGRRDVDEFAALLAAAQRRLAPAPAPPNGLCLVGVTY